MVTATAPGRVNLIGDHTDYNDGWVLPAAITRSTTVEMAPSGTDRFEVTSETIPARTSFTLDAPPTAHFASYVYGCLKEVEALGCEVPPLAIRIQSTVPIGIGLSSSAALEVAALRALRTLLDFALDDVALARMAQRAEIRYAGVNCGILDQMACSLAPVGQALFLDTRSLDYRVIPLPRESEIVVVDSGVARTLAGSGYNERRAQCEEAARFLGVPSLREADASMLNGLPPLLQRRARHVLTENDRVRRAASGIDAAEFGALMNESHRSLRGDYESSAPDVDALVEALCADPAIFGARITGGGFGGACVALAREGEGTAAAIRAIDRYEGTGTRSARIVV